MTSPGARLRGRNWDAFADAVREAVASGPAGEAELVAVVGELPAARRVLVVAALGDATGEAGPAALRSVVDTGREQDLLCAAVLALAKRCGAEASADLLAALSSKHSAVKDYAVAGLAGAGDGRAWEEVFTRLRHLLGRSARRHGDVHSSPVAAAICYLGGHLDGDRCARLVRRLRQRWDRLDADERDWLTGVWPGVGPDGPAVDGVVPPDPAALRAWIRHPLFEPIH
ncbi:hypothetical protein L6E12_09670 [Actinokineospora sp. PR83]|uniref:hypothetical protein n=1 Tax=Actinokineospora sp. PR83 TaxID=2884908 RepID=UPI001F2806AB|nr:hypothetical protein [Actinokineospora sp. PR83]MCG8916057.1 hypothetical protein [Actinokineospora sp. PR83]